MSGSCATYRAGVLAETLAALYLRAKGYKICARRYKTKVGEIDIIARRGGSLVFVEVKYRRRQENAGYAIDTASLARIRRAAQWYLSERDVPAYDEIRFDAVLVCPYPIHRIITHLENVSMP